MSFITINASLAHLLETTFRSSLTNCLAARSGIHGSGSEPKQTGMARSKICPRCASPSLCGTSVPQDQSSPLAHRQSRD
jgi:hypothetical protein